MLDVYLSGNPVFLAIALVDTNGARLYPNTIDYRILDSAGTEILASTSLVYALDDAEVEISIPANLNTLSGINRDIRNVELTLVTDNATIVLNRRYVVETLNTLTVDENTFMLLDEALLLALDIPNTQSWDAATRLEQTAALKSAYANVSALNFQLDEDDFELETFRYQDLTATQIAALPAAFVSALKKAQVSECDYILGGEWIEDKRRDGLMSETIGESSNMFRPGKPLKMSVSSGAMHHLRGYIYFSQAIGRG